jgi:uncharacterized hydrophobic protein (TIGR00271 family)
MLHRDANESLSYWLQLTVSVGIATLGLVVGSAAVVIGAMLIAPLMGPIIGLAMGLATGSPFLVLRSAGRIILSVTLSVASAAVITLLLPFHELNAELAARSTPTVLDLVTAAFCALAGVYASLRSGSDTATTAAGTSIGISLVPPLCASGYGLGTVNGVLARGAALLFLTNLVAIVAVGCACFLAAGFNRASVVALERQELTEGSGAPVARVFARRLLFLFESRLGPLFRFIMPFALLALVYFPLRRALDEVAWQVTARRAVKDALEAEPRPIVESKVQVARHAVELVVVMLGTTAEAEATRARLDERIRLGSGVKPRLEVVGVPDARAFAGLESTLLKPRTTQPSEAAPPLVERTARSLDEVAVAVREAWPEKALGRLSSVAVESDPAGGLRLYTRHWGSPLGAVSAELLQRSLASVLGGPVRLSDMALSAAAVTRSSGDTEFLVSAARLAQAAQSFEDATLCLETPPPPANGRRPNGAERALASAVDGLLATAARVERQIGEDFALRASRETCFPAQPAGTQ